MKRPIVGFRMDEESHWVAELSCGHGQHARHVPPLSERPWVLSAEGRAARVGTELECVRCDRYEVPESWEPYRRTPEFTEESVPAALRAAHTTKAGVWALIQVVRGRLRYGIHEPVERVAELVPGSPGVVSPEVRHHVEPLGEVVFFVEFWRAPQLRSTQRSG